MAARKILAEAGCRWLPTFFDTNVLTSTSPAPWTTVPKYNAQVVLSNHLFVVEVDDQDQGLEHFEDLVETQSPTLRWRSRRGPRVVFRLPVESAPLRHGAKPLTGLEILTDRVMAPGSTVKGVYLAVEDLQPIATVDEHFASELAKLAPGKAPPARRTTYVVQAAWWSPASRRLRAKDASVDGRPSRAAVSPGSAELREAWLAEDRVTHRHRAQYKLALQMHRFGETFEAFVDLVVTNPVGANLKGRGRPETWLRATWDKAGAEVRGSTRPVLPPAHAGQTGCPDDAAVWLSASLERLHALWPDNQARTRRLADLLQLHASWMARFGPVYHLSNDVMQTFLDSTSNSQLDKSLGLLKDHGFLRARPDLRDRQEWSMYWEPLINNEPLPDSPATWVTSTPPTPDLAFLADEEINDLLQMAQRWEVAALKKRRLNARSERIRQVRRRAGDAGDAQT